MLYINNVSDFGSVGHIFYKSPLEKILRCIVGGMRRPRNGTITSNPPICQCFVQTCRTSSYTKTGFSPEQKREDIAFHINLCGERNTIMSGMDKVLQTSLKCQRARQTLPQFAEIQSNASLSNDDDTLELSSTASTLSQTTDYGEAGTSFRSE